MRFRFQRAAPLFRLVDAFSPALRVGRKMHQQDGLFMHAPLESDVMLGVFYLDGL